MIFIISLFLIATRSGLITSWAGGIFLQKNGRAQRSPVYFYITVPLLNNRTARMLNPAEKSSHAVVYICKAVFEHCPFNPQIAAEIFKLKRIFFHIFAHFNTFECAFHKRLAEPAGIIHCHLWQIADKLERKVYDKHKQRLIFV
jgi:hypothetical protein